MIHSYTQNGFNIVIDINSGSVHVLDDLSFKIVRLIAPPMTKRCPQSVISELCDYPEANVNEAYGELYELYENEMLFSNDDYINAGNLSVKGAPVKAVCLHVSHDCNLRCGYCFAGTGDFGTGHRRMMDKNTAAEAIDFIVRRSGSRVNLDVDFFGGEPLMAFDTVKSTVEYARSIEKACNKKFHFTITTNGMLLDDEITDYINNNMDNVVLSLDGCKKTNDGVRITPAGNGSYERIVPLFQNLVSRRAGKDYYVRGTFTAKNLSFYNDVLHIAGLGFKNISVEPVIADENSVYALHENDLDEIYLQYENLAREILHREGRDDEFGFFHMQVDLQQGPCVIKRIRGCGAGFEYVAVTPDGEIYPCHQFVGRDEFKLGSLYDDSFDQAISDRFACQNVFTRDECRECWARFYCSGGCAASNVIANNDISKPYHLGCELEKKRLECAIMISAAKATKNA